MILDTNALSAFADGNPDLGTLMGQEHDLLPVGRGTARRYAEIRRELREAGQPIPTNDLWIAALTRDHGSPLVSRDRHFEAVRGLRVLAW